MYQKKIINEECELEPSRGPLTIRMSPLIVWAPRGCAEMTYMYVIGTQRVN